MAARSSRRSASRRRAGRRTAGALAGALLTASVIAGLSFGYAPVGGELRISQVDADANRDGLDPAVAYNPNANEYLAVWEADNLATDGETEIFGQRLSATGAELGTDFRISNVGSDGDAARDGLVPAVAFNPAASEYLVVWEGDGLATDNEFEIFGQRISAAGLEVGTDFRISTVGTDTDANRDGFGAAVAFNPLAGEYLVAWFGDGLATDNEFEIFAQRLSAAGVELGADLRVSTVGTDGDPLRSAADPAIAHAATSGEYLVAWEGDGLATDEEFEIFGQRLTAAGAEAGTDFRISQAGTDGDVSAGAANPAISYGSAPNQHLVAWEGEGLATPDELEIFGQRVSVAGAEVGGDFRISNVGADTDPDVGASNPALSYSSARNEYVAVWEGDGLLTPDELEIFGQRIDAATAEIGGDFRISTVGTDTDVAREATNPAVAYGSTSDEYLATWDGDDLQTDNEFEVFGRRLGFGAPADAEEERRCFGRPVTITGTGGSDRLRGTPGDDVITALGGRDVLTGLSGADLICGGKGRDTISGGSGNDTLFGGAGSDQIAGNRGADRLFGGTPGAPPAKAFDVCRGGPGGDKTRNCERESS